MSQTRSKTAIHLIGNPLEDFGGRMLPTSLEVLKVYFNYRKKENMSQKDALKTVVQKLCDIWKRAGISVRLERDIRKMNSLLENYTKVCVNKKRGGPAQNLREAAFVESINVLFDIARHDALDFIQIEEDKLFLIDQRSERICAMSGVDKNLVMKEQRKASRASKEDERFHREEIRKRKATAAAQLSSSSDEDEHNPIDDYNNDPEIRFNVTNTSSPSTSKSTEKRAKTNVSHGISTNIASALDRTNISNSL